LELGWVITKDSLLEYLRLALAEVSESEEGNRVAERLWEERDEQNAYEDCEKTLDLYVISV
jgi:hypothetical protein